MPRNNHFWTMSVLLLAPLAAAAQPAGRQTKPGSNKPAAGKPSTPMNPMAPAVGAPMAPMAPITSAKNEWPTEIFGHNLDWWIRQLDPEVNKDPAQRELAVRVVPQFGEPAKKAIPKIVDRLGDREYAVKMTALQVVTIANIEDPEQRKEIIRRLFN